MRFIQDIYLAKGLTPNQVLSCSRHVCSELIMGSAIIFDVCFFMKLEEPATTSYHLKLEAHILAVSTSRNTILELIMVGISRNSRIGATTFHSCQDEHVVPLRHASSCLFPVTIYYTYHKARVNQSKPNVNSPLSHESSKQLGLTEEEVEKLNGYMQEWMENFPEYEHLQCGLRRYDTSTGNGQRRPNNTCCYHPRYD